MKREQLVGTWKRVEGSAPYPEALTFGANGIYQGEHPPGRYCVWDVGRFSIEGDDAIVLSTANDAEVAYDVTLANGDLTLRDRDGTVLRYRKS